MGKSVPKQRIVVARYKEDVSWLDKLPDWQPVVIQKQTDELAGDMPNAGREPASFLFAVAKHYKTIRPDDVWAFVQGDPFPHCIDLYSKLRQYSDTPRYKHLGGYTKQCSGSGEPDHPKLPVKELYEKWLDRPCPTTLEFVPGGQFIVRGRDLLLRPRDWYLEVMDDSTAEWNCYVLERIWSEIFDL